MKPRQSSKCIQRTSKSSFKTTSSENFLMYHILHPPCSFTCFLKQKSMRKVWIFSTFFAYSSCSLEEKLQSQTDKRTVDIAQTSERILTACELHERNKSLLSEETSPGEIKPKRTRQPERVIRQVILLVKIWRGLYEIKKWSLITAATLIGISKKSLDDYYLVLRAGEILGYDFQEGLKLKMGELRSFIRSKDVKVSGKLGKVIHSFNLVHKWIWMCLLRGLMNKKSIKLDNLLSIIALTILTSISLNGP